MSSKSQLSSREYHEKRDFIRMRVDSPVQVQIKGQKETFTGVCRDLSGGGMMIEVDTALPIGTEVEVALASSHGHAPMLQASAKVCRIESQPESESHPSRVGLELTNILA